MTGKLIGWIDTKVVPQTVFLQMNITNSQRFMTNRVHADTRRQVYLEHHMVAPVELARRRVSSAICSVIGELWKAAKSPLGNLGVW